MRYSSLLGRTLRDAPSGTDIASAALLHRAGFIRQLGAGIYTLLPLGWRSIRKIETIIREEMERIDCHELLMPFVQPADLWKETGRWEKIDDELVRFADRTGRDMVLAMTHEEVATDLVRREIRSYRQLPHAFFQIQTKFRDEPRPRAGLLRGREFIMKDAYSFHTDESDQLRFYADCHRAYLRAFARCGIPVVVVGAAAGIMGGAGSHEYMLETPAGEDVLFSCPNGDYASNREVATSALDIADDTPLLLEEVETPGTNTIEAVAGYLGVDTSRTLKAVFYEAGGRLVFVAIRGDRQVNEVKLQALLDVKALAPASDQLIRASGAVPGFASPVGIGGSNAIIVADRSAATPNLVGGANRTGYHLRNVNLGRDYAPDHLADIALVQAGDPCPVCHAPLAETRGIEVGNIFRLGTVYSGPLNANYRDEDGNEHPIVMGSYGFGVTRMLAAIAEHCHDERGLLWPVSIAPFDAHLLVLGPDAEVRARADALHSELERAGIEVLYDDRNESAGVKFADADLIGIPFRLTVSSRSLAAGGVEIKPRGGDSQFALTVSFDEIVPMLHEQLSTKRQEMLHAAALAAEQAEQHSLLGTFPAL